DPSTPEIYTLSLHDALPILSVFSWMISSRIVRGMTMSLREREFVAAARYMGVSNTRIIIRHIVPNVASIIIIDTALNVGLAVLRSEEHTSELQSRSDLVCRL